MTLVQVALALVAVGGAVVAVSGREPRFATLGMIVALLAAAYVADPLPGTIALGARLVGTVLGGYLLWVALRGAPAPAAGSSMGWPGATAIGIAAFSAGWLAAVTIGAALAAPAGNGPSIGAGAIALADGSNVSRAAVGVAFALTALAAGPVLLARDALRLGLGLLLLVGAAERLITTLAGRSEDIVVLGFALLIAAGGAAAAGLVGRSLRVHADLALRAPSMREVAVRSRGADEAHPLDPHR